jgi:hypothetical protein
MPRPEVSLRTPILRLATSRGGEYSEAYATERKSNDGGSAREGACQSSHGCCYFGESVHFDLRMASPWRCSTPASRHGNLSVRLATPSPESLTSLQGVQALTSV